ncbi:gp36+37 fusion long tail fiber distal subunit [Vibrio phage nt-1]|uniref:Long tail fiber protein Gp37 n=1 Tax=Vibrio phage nt-1 TaxID=115992 RepID=R9TFT8_9CAUD|nr:long tail fiber protein distal subunit [Vibrio phage nt-1]AGN30344.1 gp36+37 fusion long tail fiber distal subunit [Vibrio phage nt-1]
MAELRSTTAIGGNIVWHGGNLRFDPQGDTILYQGYKIYTEFDTPLPGELGNGGTTSAYTKTESNALFAPIHAGGYVKKDGDTMTGKLINSANEIEINGTSPRLLLKETDATNKQWFVIADNSTLSIREDTTATTRMRIATDNLNLNLSNLDMNDKTTIRSFDSWLRINDQAAYVTGVYFGSSLVRTDGTFQISNGDTFNVNASVFTYNGGNVFHDAYHPNADKWTTARTLTLAGDATGSVSIDGSSNATLTVAVVNDSHTHDGRYYTETEADSRFANVTGDTFTGNVAISKAGGRLSFNETDYVNTNSGINWITSPGQNLELVHEITDGELNTTGGNGQALQIRSNGGTVAQAGLEVEGEIFAKVNQRVFHDAYHPNADTWTTARTITLAGDLSGSVSINGGSNVTLTATVANDSHTHDGRYFTESESDARYVNIGGDTMTGNLTMGSNLVNFKSGGDVTLPNILGIRSSIDLNSRLFTNEGGLSYTTYESSAANIPSGVTNNANGVITLNTHTGAYNHQLSFNSSGQMHHRSGTGSWSRLFADNYHPNADKWTTARTITLAGDLTGSVSIDGSANVTLSAEVTNDSHTHNRLNPMNANWNSQTQEFRTGTTSAPAGSGLSNFLNWIQWGHNGGSKYRHTLYSFADNAAMAQLWYAYKNNTSDTTSAATKQRIFMDNYHPNADTWTTARTLTLAGDATGSVSINGGSNVTLTVAVANDSHTHDGRYYTESESNSRFAQNSEFSTGATFASIAGKYLPKVTTSGVLEMGRYIDFHTTDSTADYDIRLDCNSSGSLSVVGGTLNGSFVGSLSGNASTASWADTVDVNTSTSTASFGLVWHSGDTLYASENQGLTVRPSDGFTKIKHGYLCNERLQFDTTGRIYPRLTSQRRSGMYGIYDSTKIGHIWSMGSGFMIADDGSTFGNMYGFAYKHTNNATGGNMAGGHQAVWCINGTGKSAMGENIWTAGNVTAYSDIRVKTNIERIDNPLEKVSKISGYTYDRTDQECPRQTGVIAQEILEVLPEAVMGGPTDDDPEGHYSVAYGNLVGLLIEATKELNEKVETLQSEVQELKRPWWKKLFRL